LFRDLKTGQLFDPAKVFGTIDPERSLKYDDITTSYPVMLPADYYYKYIKSQMPDEEKEKKWFIRPHHIENLTDHRRSIRDDVLNTHYFSHYNQKYGQVPEISTSAEAIEHIEHMLERLRSQAERHEGCLTMEAQDAKRKEVANEAQEDYEKFMGNKQLRFNSLELAIQAYEDVLYQYRREEAEQLNVVRMREYEKNRPPADYWYQIKNNSFH
jgi:hypothetical protein